jgi:hypothetical protein
MRLDLPRHLDHRHQAGVEAEQVERLPGEGGRDLAEELREILYLDQAELLAVDRPRDVVVASEDGIGGAPPFPPPRLVAATGARPPAGARDHGGRDVRDRLARIDGRFADGFAAIGFQGYAEEHSLTLDFDAVADRSRTVLVLTGGYYWSEAES